MVTDKELLTFCNLTNLKMEYANLIKKEKKKDKNGNSLDEEISTNHTIYSLLDSEINSFKIKKNLNIKNVKFLKMKLNSLDPSDDYDIEELKKLIEENEKNLEKNRKEKFGSFYIVDQNKDVSDYFYYDMKDIQEKAPLVLERYLRYKYTDKKELHSFIDDWEIIDFFDNYSYGEAIYNELQERNKEAKEEAKKHLKEYERTVVKELDFLDSEEKNFIENIKNFLTDIANEPFPPMKTREEIKEMGEKYLSIQNGKMLFSLGMSTALELGLNKLIPGIGKQGLKVVIKIQKKYMAQKIKSIPLRRNYNHTSRNINKAVDLQMKKNIKVGSSIIDTIFDKEKSGEIILNETGITKGLENLENKILTSSWIRKIGLSDKLIKVVISEGSKKIREETIDTFNKTDSKDLMEKHLKETGERYLSENENNLNPEMEITNLIGFKQSFDISQEGISLIVLKNKSTKKVAIAIKNLSSLEEINQSLNEGEIPKELFQLDMFLNFLMEKHQLQFEDITLTGIGNGGKLASIYKIYNEKINCKGYFDSDPLNISTVVDFTGKDISIFDKKFTHRNIPELICFSSLGETKEDLTKFIGSLIGLGISLAGGGVYVGAFLLILYLGSELISLYENYKSNEQMEKFLQKLFKTLEDNKVLENIKPLESFQSEAILGKILENIPQEFILNLKYKINSAYRDNYMQILLNHWNLTYSKEEISSSHMVKDLKNFLTLLFLTNTLEYKILKTTSKEIVLGNSNLENLLIFSSNEQKLFKLVAKEYEYEVENSIGRVDKKKSRFINESNKDEIKEIKNNSNIEIPPQDPYLDLTNSYSYYPINSEYFKAQKEFSKEIDDLIEGKIKSGVYYERVSVGDEFQFGEHMNTLINTFRTLQENMKNLLDTSMGILLEKDKNYIGMNRYTLKKKELNKINGVTTNEEDFMYFVDETSGNINEETTDIYENLNSGYIGSLLRTALYDNTIDKSISIEHMTNKILNNFKEDILDIYRITELNYKEHILKRLRSKSYDKNYLYIKEISENLSEKDLDKYTRIKTLPTGDKYLIVGILENDEYGNGFFGHTVSYRTKFKPRVLNINLMPLTKDEKNRLINGVTTSVCDGAELKCPMGTAPLFLKVTSQDYYTLDGLLKATENDIVPMKNIKPKEAKCKLKVTPSGYLPCVPETKKWENTSECETIDGGASLISSSTCICNFGQCKITITDPKSDAVLE